MSADGRPIALVTGVVSAYREEPFRLLAEREGAEVLAWGDPGERAGLPVRPVNQANAARLVASGRYRAVVCGLGGRLALPATYVAARRAGIPFVLWASLWRHPRTPAHALSWIPSALMYRRADAVVTYGPHVTRYVSRFRRSRVFEAPQAVPQWFGAPVDGAQRAHWRERAGAGRSDAVVLFAGRLEREKGVEVLLDAWARGDGDDAVLAFAGQGPLEPRVRQAGHAHLGQVAWRDLPALYAAADVLVLPSVPTATFLEPWGLVVNEAMLQGTPVIASDAVGAAAGGLVRHGRNGLVVPAGRPELLGAALRSLIADDVLRERLGAAAREDVAPYTAAAWAAGVGSALEAVGAGAG